MRTFPHEPDKDTLLQLEEQYLQHLVNFHTIRDQALKLGQPELILDFAPFALGLGWLAWWRGRPPEDVAEFAGDAIAIALAGTEATAAFGSPYDYWLLTCAAVALDHPGAERLLVLPAKRWSHTLTHKVEGMLPGLVVGLAAAAGANGNPDAAVLSVQQLLRAGLDTPEDREEALRFAPAVGALASIQTSRPETWITACEARRDGWLAEARRFPNAPMFLIDWEWLAFMRLARDAGFELPEDDDLRPHALLEAGAVDAGTMGDRLGPP